VPKPLCPVELVGAPQLRESSIVALMNEFVQQPVLPLIAPVGTMTPVARPLKAQLMTGDAHKFTTAASRPASRHTRLTRTSDTPRRLSLLSTVKFRIVRGQIQDNLVQYLNSTNSTIAQAVDSI
jgi:hypothetical protein